MGDQAALKSVQEGAGEEFPRCPSRRSERPQQPDDL